MRRLFLLMAALALPATGDDITLGWDAVDDERVAVYEVHSGLASGDYTESTETTGTQVVVSLSEPGEYFFAVRACDADKLRCSRFSDEVSYTVAPRLQPPGSFRIERVEVTVISIPVGE